MAFPCYFCSQLYARNLIKYRALLCRNLSAVFRPVAFTLYSKSEIGRLFDSENSNVTLVNWEYFMKKATVQFQHLMSSCFYPTFLVQPFPRLKFHAIMDNHSKYRWNGPASDWLCRTNVIDCDGKWDTARRIDAQVKKCHESLSSNFLESCGHLMADHCSDKAMTMDFRKPLLSCTAMVNHWALVSHAGQGPMGKPWAMSFYRGNYDFKATDRGRVGIKVGFRKVGNHVWRIG